MSAETPTFAPEPSQPGIDALANLFDNPERRNALIDRVVFSSSTQPLPGFETPIFEPLANRHERADIAKLRLALLRADGKSYEVIDGNGVNPFFRAQPADVFPQPVAPSFKERLGLKIATLKDTIVHSRPAKLAGRAALATAIASGSSAPALAEGFRVSGGGTNPTAECINDVILVYKAPTLIAAAGDATTTDQRTTQPGAELPQDVEIALAPGVTLVNAPPCPTPEPPSEITTPENPYGSKRIDIFNKIASQPKSEIAEVSLGDLEKALNQLLDPKYADFLSKGQMIEDGREYVRLYFDKQLLEKLLDRFDAKSKYFKEFRIGYRREDWDEALIDFRRDGARILISEILGVAIMGQNQKVTEDQAKLIQEIWDMTFKVVDMTYDYGVGLSPKEREGFDTSISSGLAQHSY